MSLTARRLSRLRPPTCQRLLTGRVEDWRACDGRSLCALSSRCSFASVTHYFGDAMFPAPAASNAVCGFPALRSPVGFTPKLM